MKKFMIRGSCFAAIGLMLLAVVNTFYIRTNGYRSLDDTFKFYLIPEDIEVANLGSSHGAYGFYYDDLERITGFNFALPGQSLYYDLQLLRKYGDRLAEGCVVVIPLSYFSFDMVIGSDVQNMWYYKFLGYGSIYDHRLPEYIKYGLCPFLTAHLNAKYLINDKASIDFDVFWIYKYFGTDYDVNDEEAWRRDALGFLDFYYVMTDEGRNEDRNMTYLESIIEYCRENGFEPVLVTTPVTSYYKELFAGEILDGFNRQLSEVKEKYGVPYIDYSSDPRISDRLELFSDSSHLNDCGRRVFTKLLLSDLGLI